MDDGEAAERQFSGDDGEDAARAVFPGVNQLGQRPAALLRQRRPAVDSPRHEFEEWLNVLISEAVHAAAAFCPTPPLPSLATARPPSPPPR